jgi:hypothetical protein
MIRSAALPLRLCKVTASDGVVSVSLGTLLSSDNAAEPGYGDDGIQCMLTLASDHTKVYVSIALAVQLA